MKVAVIFLDYLRHEHTKPTLQSLALAGYPFDLFTIQEKGIAKAINKGIDLTRKYDAIVTCANDIKMPDNWLLKMVEYTEAIYNTGMCGIHCVEHIGTLQIMNGKQIRTNDAAFGNVMIPRAAIDSVGYFNEDYDPYGMQDSDYGYRLLKSGFINYYIDGIYSEHIGHDVGLQTDYRRMKDEGLAVSAEKWKYWIDLYEQINNYKI